MQQSNNSETSSDIPKVPSPTLSNKMHYPIVMLKFM